MFLVKSCEVVDEKERPQGDDINTYVVFKGDAEELVRDLNERKSVHWAKMMGKSSRKI
jgi:hypothetical protein